MSLAAITAKIRGVALHLVRADTGGYFCGIRVTGNTLSTWNPKQATCKRRLARYAEYRREE